VGYNPYRKKVIRKGDFAILAVAAIVVLAIVAWAFFG
jgi:hypothetical protein